MSLLDEAIKEVVRRRLEGVTRLPGKHCKILVRLQIKPTTIPVACIICDHPFEKGDKVLRVGLSRNPVCILCLLVQLVDELGSDMIFNEWPCLYCGELNAARRRKCSKCGALRGNRIRRSYDCGQSLA